MNESLKPCPFCGGPARIFTRKDESLSSHDIVTWFDVTCANEGEYFAQLDCPGYEPPSSEDSAEAIAAWNRRTPSDQIKENE